jgi:hypothetical protein
MTVLITLTTAGSLTGPFNLCTNIDGFVTPFETGVAKSVLVAGYTCVLVPTGTTSIQVRSTGVCIDVITLPIVGVSTTTSTTVAPTTLTTSTTTAPVGTTSTTSTTTSTSTTSTTTTTIPPLTCAAFILNAPGTSGEINYATYIDCFGIEQTIAAEGYSNQQFCASSIVSGSVSYSGICGA